MIIVGDPEIESSKILVICCDVSTWWDTWNSISSSRQNKQSNYSNTSQAKVCHKHILLQTSQKGLDFFSLLHPHSRVDMGLIRPLFHSKTRQLKGLPDNLLIDYSFHHNTRTSLKVPQYPTHCYQEVVPKEQSSCRIGVKLSSFVQQPQMYLLYWLLKSIQHWQNDNWKGKCKVLRKNLPHCQAVHHIPHTQ